MKVLNVYTDGGYRPQLKIGAYGYLVVDNSNKIIKQHARAMLDTSVYNVTNNKMEMLGVIKALNWLRSNGFNPNENRIYLYTDSQYVQLGITEWIYNWKMNNWKTSNKKPVKNKELWMTIDKLVSFEFKSLHFQWVQGHNGNKYNEIVDKLCTDAINNKL